MATVKRLSVTRWYIADPTHPKGRREVKPGTLGALKTTEEGATYFVVWKEGGKTRREATGLTDKRAAQKYLTDWLTARERGERGLTDPHKEDKERAICDHLEDYLTSLRSRSKSAYPAEVERELTTLFTVAKLITLRDLTPAALRKHLDKMTGSARTKNLLRTYAVGFLNYLVSTNRIPANPITKHSVPTYQDSDREPRRRRAMTPGELRKLVNAVRDYPLIARSVNKGGRPKRDGTPAQQRKAVSLSDSYRATLTQTGRERHLLYRLAIATGLRRGELSRVKVRHLFLTITPARIDYTLTKNKRRAIVPIPATLAADLRQWITDTNKTPSDPLLTVPNRSNLLARVHKPVLKLAGIDYSNQDGSADFHALRKSLNLFLAGRNIPHRDRQRVMRHAAGDVTSKHYDTTSDPRPTATGRVFKLLTRLDRYLTRTATDQDATQTPPAATT